MDAQTPTCLIVQGLLIRGLPSSPDDYPAQATDPQGEGRDLLYLKDVEIYSGGALVAEMEHLALDRRAVAGVSAGAVKLAGG